MMHLSRLCALGFAAIALSAGAAHAQFGVGARAMGMGGAFTAIAEGDGAAYWNPASAATQRGVHFSLPSLSVFVTGPINVGDALDGFPSSTDSQVDFARKFASGITDVSGAAFTGFSTGSFDGSLMVFARGQVIPIDSDGTVGQLTMTPEFTISQIHAVAVTEFEAAGENPALAAQNADQVVSQVQTSLKGGTKFSIPVYNGQLTGHADVYASAFATTGKKVNDKLSVGVNMKLVAARRITALGQLNSATLQQKLSEATGGNATPDLVNRVLADLNLRKPDGTLFTGSELAGAGTFSTRTSSQEIAPSADLGALYRVSKKTKLGFVLRNALPARFSNAASLNPYLDMGIACQAVPRKLLVAADVTNVFDTGGVQLNAGVEWTPTNQLALRAGVYRSHLTFGFGIGRYFNVAAGSGMSLLSFGLGF